jgi:hypothetical protein
MIFHKQHANTAQWASRLFGHWRGPSLNLTGCFMKAIHDTVKRARSLTYLF